MTVGNSFCLTAADGERQLCVVGDGGLTSVWGEEGWSRSTCSGCWYVIRSTGVPGGSHTVGVTVSKKLILWLGLGVVW